MVMKITEEQLKEHLDKAYQKGYHQGTADAIGSVYKFLNNVFGYAYENWESPLGLIEPPSNEYLDTYLEKIFDDIKKGK